MRDISMLILCFVVAGAMALVLRWFFRRLRTIEAEMWGEKARQARESREKKDEKK